MSNIYNSCIDVNNHLYEQTIMCLADAYVHFKTNGFLTVPQCSKNIPNKYVSDCFYRLCQMICDGRPPEILSLEANMMINGARNEMADVSNCISIIKYALPALQQFDFMVIDSLVQDYGSSAVEKYVVDNYRDIFVQEL